MPSHLEIQWRNTILDRFPKLRKDVIFNIRPDFLKNPKTGKNLELDLYFPSYQLAIEVDGSQHYKFNPKFHNNNWVVFMNQILRDQLKEKLCRENYIYLLRVNKHSSRKNTINKIKIITSLA